MPPPESGSDGESSEKPVRERLKQTSIDKNALDVQRAEAQGTLEVVEEQNESLTSGTMQDISEDANAGIKTAQKNAQKRSLEDAAQADDSSEQDKLGEGLESEKLHTRKRTRDAQQVSGTNENDGATEGPPGRAATPTADKDADRLDAMLTSPRKKRSRESLDGEENVRSQKIQTTEGTKARRSSSEERPGGKDTVQGAETANESNDQSDRKPTFGETLKPKPADNPNDKPQTSSSAFAASGFASLSGSASPFGSLGSPSSKASDASSQPKMSAFASPAASQASAFGSSFAGSQSSFASASKAGTSGFSQLGSQTFGGGSSGFGGSSLASGPRLSSFAAPVGDVKLGAAKAEKPFGAPAENEQGSEDGSESVEEAAGAETTAPKERKDESALSPKFHVQEVQTGEDNEESVYTNRAKLFQYHVDSSSWKERGVGPVKVNVKRKPADAANLDGAESQENPTKEASKANVEARFIMRNHATHKVILNAPIFKEMTVKEPSAKQLLFACPNELGAMATYMLRMGKEDDIKHLHKVVNDLQGKM